MMLERFEKELAPLRNSLVEHPLYRQIDTIGAIRILMEDHVFAVWDFMSLVKKLQRDLSCTQLPWLPTKSAAAGRLINEIVWGEETDLNRHGQVQSHFEMYRDAMNNMGADTTAIDTFLGKLREGMDIYEAIDSLDKAPYIKDFLAFTFDVIASDKTHVVAAVFTFGREDLIPDMFVEIVKNIQKDQNENLLDLIYYLERHIELDGDEHGPMALQMIENLCGTDPEKLYEAIRAAQQALQMRINLWDGILQSIKTKQLISIES
ncbi:MAG: DUF3050 domain-containing protein [Flavobacteriaceae bacterium]